ncbi:DUF1287 domain-containing protein [Halioxenophilus sp. WMMB6]|uniref:DUF1287 domain-containing protein n=1 Tax=Halioxenophilus sp. WMMB6 TaxID=3073815 RepID=UPI00398BE30C
MAANGFVPSPAVADSAVVQLVQAAKARTQLAITYDGSYFSIAYPNGDVPADVGVCTDVVIRSYRALGIDLQQLVHEDMVANFELYPSRRVWGLTQPDTNIDHRRVLNLAVYFRRHGQELAISHNPGLYSAGDIVTWQLPGNLPHIGIVSDVRSEISGNPLVVHNMGLGPKLQDMLFDYEITGHYRFFPVDY